MIETFFTLSESEYVECQRLYVSRKTKRSRKWLILLYAIFFVGFFVFVRRIQSAWDAFIATIIAMIASTALAFVVKELLQTRNFKQRFETDSRMLTDIHLGFDDSGVHSKTKGIGEGNLEWTACTSWLESKNVFILLIGRSFSPVAKRTLSEESQKELRDLLSLKIGSVGTTRKL